MDRIVIRGAREHNLKNIDLELPRDSLVVISGLSGSGKSSLAFDTIFAEGQRRYVESLSSYARQFLGRLDKPDVDYIEGLSPAIAIEQKTTHRNPRSTVGTVTEIYDYLRLLYARVGVPHCPRCGREIREQSVDQIVDAAADPARRARRLTLLAPVVGATARASTRRCSRTRGGSGSCGCASTARSAPSTSRSSWTSGASTPSRSWSTGSRVGPEARRRLAESVEAALEVSGRHASIALVREGDGEREVLFSPADGCPTCGISIPSSQPRLFSFNNPFGACPECSGLGVTLEFDPDLVIPDRTCRSTRAASRRTTPRPTGTESQFDSLAQHFGFALDTPARRAAPESACTRSCTGRRTRSASAT